MKDFLLEIGTEELPANFANEARDQIKELGEKWLKDNNIAFEKVTTFSTPRRLTFIAYQVSESQPDVEKELKGPAASVAYDSEGNPTKALEGFCKSQNISLDSLEKRDLKGNLFVYAKITQKGKQSIDLLPQLIQHFLSSISVTRGMRWADYTTKFSRPIHNILALFGDKIVNFKIEEVISSNKTYGHRFLGNQTLTVNSVNEYFSLLKENKVTLDNEERKETIVKQLNEIANSLNAKVLISDGLLNEVTQLVEYPTAILGNFENKYLEIPQVVNVTVMKSHQRYFPLFDSNDKLLPNFITISNMHLNKENIRLGNEKVLRARLEDASFFYQEDLKYPFENNLEELKRVTYFEEIGSIYDKTQRIEKIAQRLNYLHGLNEQDISKAATLSKVDLVTNMVKEFTELQGEIGYYYALKAGENEEVAYALKEQYLPTGNNDNPPSRPLAQIINFADKFDNLVSCFALGKIPTGSKDPFSLRRQCLGIIRTCDKYKLNLDFNDLISYSYDVLNEQKQVKSNKEETISKITEFFTQRLRNDFLDQGFKHDVVDAVLDGNEVLNNVYNTQEKLRVLSNWVKDDSANETVTALARVIRICKTPIDIEIQEGFFEKEEETNLYKEIKKLNIDLDEAYNKGQFKVYLDLLCELSSPINKFFDNVMVMVEDQNVKNNRLALLNKIKDLSNNIANMDKLIV